MLRRIITFLLTILLFFCINLIGAEIYREVHDKLIAYAAAFLVIMGFLVIWYTLLEIFRS